MKTSTSSSMSVFTELLRFLFKRKKFWLTPVIFLLLVIGGLLILAQTSVLAPFIYSLF